MLPTTWPRTHFGINMSLPKKKGRSSKSLLKENIDLDRACCLLGSIIPPRVLKYLLRGPLSKHLNALIVVRESLHNIKQNWKSKLESCWPHLRLKSNGRMSPSACSCWVGLFPNFFAVHNLLCNYTRSWCHCTSTSGLKLSWTVTAYCIHFRCQVCPLLGPLGVRADSSWAGRIPRSAMNVKEHDDHLSNN